jgi:hypothetical protein
MEMLLAALAVIEAGVMAWVWAQLEASREREKAADFWLEGREERIDDLQEELEEVRAASQAREEALLDQVRDYAERLASLREAGFEPDRTRRTVEEKEMDKPLSADLRQFLDRIESPTARQLAEEDIQRMRGQGIDDEQIYQELVEGGADPWL